ncbi:synaptonemal complex central element protein 1 [Fukomys damarensis]|uniref:synaptonemal complex central element protein 1 n=1 Tax=Fukomys damarensis TaxID=885580 RepID=UPI00053F37EF|nr:synaptonemal complex central element protein 1 [Fukomys damarensis]
MVNLEQLHLEDIMRKRLETLRSFLMQCNRKDSEAQREKFEEENRKVKKFLEAAAEQRQQLQHKRQSMVAEMEMLDVQFLSETCIISGEEADKEEIEHLPQAFQELCPGP